MPHHWKFSIQLSLSCFPYLLRLVRMGKISLVQEFSSIYFLWGINWTSGKKSMEQKFFFSEKKFPETYRNLWEFIWFTNFLIRTKFILCKFSVLFFSSQSWSSVFFHIGTFVSWILLTISKLWRKSVFELRKGLNLFDFVRLTVDVTFVITWHD